MPTGYPKNGINKGRFKKGRKHIPLSSEAIERIRQSKLGSKHPLWKGDKVGYKSIHEWIGNNWGRPNLCENREITILDYQCSKICENYEWANITGKYIRNRQHWLRLCVSCHRKFDSRKNEK